MHKVDVVLKNETGLHARPASQFVSIASKYKSDIMVIKDNKEYNAKSIVRILSMGARQGTVLTIKAEGEDETDAIEALKEFLDNNLDE